MCYNSVTYPPSPWQQKYNTASPMRYSGTTRQYGGVPAGARRTQPMQVHGANTKRMTRTGRTAHYHHPPSTAHCIKRGAMASTARPRTTSVVPAGDSSGTTAAEGAGLVSTAIAAVTAVLLLLLAFVLLIVVRRSRRNSRSRADEAYVMLLSDPSLWSLQIDYAQLKLGRDVLGREGQGTVCESTALRGACGWR
jgi:hypothetical protein